MSHLKAVRDYRPVELPTTWDDADGRTIRWNNWQPGRITFICPPPTPPYACTVCGSATIPDRAEGFILPSPGETFESEELVPFKRRPGQFWARTKRVPAWPVVRLAASRCPDCLTPEIYDTGTDTVHVPPWDDPSEVTQ